MGGAKALQRPSEKQSPVSFLGGTVAFSLGGPAWWPQPAMRGSCSRSQGGLGQRQEEPEDHGVVEREGHQGIIKSDRLQCAEKQTQPSRSGGSPPSRKSPETEEPGELLKAKYPALYKGLD